MARKPTKKPRPNLPKGTRRTTGVGSIIKNVTTKRKGSSGSTSATLG